MRDRYFLFATVNGNFRGASTFSTPAPLFFGWPGYQIRRGEEAAPKSAT
jgi:hypothetical protein